MKKIESILTVILSLSVLAGCSKTSHRTIRSESSKDYLSIEYAGNAYFNANKTLITHISHGGYVKYEHNSRTLDARNNPQGGINYKLYDNGRQLTLNEEGKNFIAAAVQDMAKRGHNADMR